MLIYLLNIFMILILGIFFLENHTNNQYKKFFVIIVSLQWIFISGFRHWSVGADTLNYYRSFISKLNITWSEVLTTFKGFYFEGLEGKDEGYVVFVKIMQLFSSNYQVYLIIIATIFFTSFGYFIYKNSSEPVISYLLFSTLFFSFFAITGIRQTIVAAACFLAYELIKKKKLFPFLLLLLISTTIHSSALIFIPFYFLANKKITRFYLLFALFLFPALMIFRVPYSLYFQKISGYDYGVYSEAGTTTFTIMFLLVAIIAFWRAKPIIHANPQAVHFYNALILALLTIPLTWVNPSAMRVVQYFSIFLVLLIPEIIKSFKVESPKFEVLSYYTIVSMLLLLFVRAQQNANYMFFWE